MSYDDDHRGTPHAGRERGAYTPPTDDDLPFERRSYDPRRAPAAKAPPITLIISMGVLIALIIALAYMWGTSGARKSGDVPPAVGAPVESMKVEAPLDAQPIDPEAGVRVYRDGGEAVGAAPTFTPGPEAVEPRPAPQPLPAAPTALPP
ncbi:MAG: SPOR domain-containing protein, partial [Brevundimonas sp.]